MTDELNAKTARICASCACFYEQEMPGNPLQKQGFCRRNPPQYGMMKVQTPRLDINKQIVLGKDGKPIMETNEQGVYLYPPTLQNLTCFDGWRPIGELPGKENPLLARYLTIARVPGNFDPGIAATDKKN
ncbi:MAG: hypothetical protein ACREQ5_16655 [Candidatus Dormibacteria bacterium]